MRHLIPSLLIAVLVITCSGCGVSGPSMPDFDPEQLGPGLPPLPPGVAPPHPESPALASDSDAGPPDKPDVEDAPCQLVAAPFPNRRNPFEFGEGFDESLQSEEQDEFSLKLFGFVGATSPKAILNLNGRTRVLSAGDRWGQLTVVDVSPPEVRVRMGGVVRVWSLLGDQDPSK